jgi:transposase
MTVTDRIEKIIRIMEEIEKSSLSVSQYFKEKPVPFGQTQYYYYKKIIEEKGKDGLIDQRNKGNHLKFNEEMKNFVKGLLNRNRYMTSKDVQNVISNEFRTTISITVLNDFRRRNNFTFIRPKIVQNPINESGASEIAIALAMETGIIDAITDSICLGVEKVKESERFKESISKPKDHPDLRLKGKFTFKYNNSEQVRESRFKHLDEKIDNKKFDTMRIFSLSRESIKRHSLALFSLPLVTANGRVRSVDNPRGDALKYLCGFNYRASTLDMHVRDLKYLQISNLLIETTAKFWIDFWSSRNKSDNIFVCYYIDGNTKALWSSKPCHKGKVTMLGRVMNCLEQVFIHDGQGHPLYFQTFNGHADFGKNALKMMDQISKYLEKNTDLENQFTVNRILVMDAAGNGVRTLREMDQSYLFSWKEIPGNDSERFTDFLKLNYDVDWVTTAKITKTDDDKTIIITGERNFISLSLDKENTELNLKIDNDKTDKFIVKTENGKLNIYDKSIYYFITMLDSNQVNDRKVKFLSEKKRYEFGKAYLTDYMIELLDSNDKGYVYETRAVQVDWDNGRTCVLITSLPIEIFSTDNVVKSYFDRWPAQELSFKDMKSKVNINRVVGYTKKLINNEKVLENIEKLQNQIAELEEELELPLKKIKDIEEIMQSKINQERIYREKSIIVNGERILSELDAQILKDIQAEIKSLDRKIKAIEMEDEKLFNSFKSKKTELARIIDKKKIYSVDVELDQIMTCYKISLANICCYFLEKCLNGEKMTLQQIFEKIFELRAKVKIDGDQRNIMIKRNLKQKDMMKRLESGFEILNYLRIKDIYGNIYNFKFLQFNPF